jgi:hypothetical protein
VDYLCVISVGKGGGVHLGEEGRRGECAIMWARWGGGQLGFLIGHDLSVYSPGIFYRVACSI